MAKIKRDFDESENMALGSYLFAAERDSRKIMLDIAIRRGIVVFALIVQFFSGKTYSAGVEIAALVAYAIFAAWPLAHLKDGMEFYRYGILCRGRAYPVDERTKAVWRGYGKGIFITTYLELSGLKRINVTYIKGAKKLFYRAYGKVIDYREENLWIHRKSS